MKYRTSEVIEAITFDEFVEYGKSVCATLTNGMPWAFAYKTHRVTHETDDCYLVPAKSGKHVRFERGEMLVLRPSGEIYPCKPDIFAATYEAV